MILRKAVHALLAKVESRTIYGHAGRYLTKYKLLDLGKDRVRVYVHNFHRSDEDPELHSHPWEWSVSIILKGGYAEVKDCGGYFERTIFKPLSINIIQHDDFHRVELLEWEAWTLFIAGPERHPWYFLDLFTRERIPWREFIGRKGLVP